MNDRVLVSVIMSVFNSEQYLDEAVTSILNQTFINFEFIIINDGSTDLSLSILNKYQNMDSRIKIINQDNAGLPRSLNKAIALSEGKYICRMDSDDISLPTRIEEQVTYLEMNPNIGICGTWAEVFGDECRIISHPTAHEKLKAQLLFNVSFVHPSVMIRRSVIEKSMLMYNERYTNSQDYKLWSELSRETKMANIPKVLLKYRATEGSITAKTNKLYSNSRYLLSKEIYAKFLEELNIEYSESMLQLHHSIGVKDRILECDISIDDVEKYFLNISNSNNGVYNQRYLNETLGFKYFAFVYYKFKRSPQIILKAIRSRFFYLGLLYSLKVKLFSI